MRKVLIPLTFAVLAIPAVASAAPPGTYCHTVTMPDGRFIQYELTSDVEVADDWAYFATSGPCAEPTVENDGGETIYDVAALTSGDPAMTLGDLSIRLPFDRSRVR